MFWIEKLDKGKMKPSKLYMVLLGIFLFALVMALETTNYIVVEPTIDDQQNWITNITDKCPGAKMDEAFEAKSEIENGVMGFVFGCYFGVLFFGMRMSHLANVEVKNEAWWKPIFRILITIVICAIPLLPYHFLTPDVISNIYVLMICKTLVPTFIAGFLLYCGLLELIFMKLNLLKINLSIDDPLTF